VVGVRKKVEYLSALGSGKKKKSRNSGILGTRRVSRFSTFFWEVMEGPVLRRSMRTSFQIPLSPPKRKSDWFLKTRIVKKQVTGVCGSIVFF
jgi:hypothetical protein